MKLCCNCFEELLDREMVCPICNSNITLNNNQTKDLFCLVKEVNNASRIKKNFLKKDPKYELVFKYIEHKKHPQNSNDSYPKILDLSYKNNSCESQEEYWNRINQHTINKAELDKPTVECPYCHSTNTKKISGTSKAVNTAVFGIFGTKRFKQWHCNNCKSDF